MSENEQNEIEPTSFKAGEKIERQVIGRFVKKDYFLDNPTRCIVKNGGKNKYGYWLSTEVEGDLLNFPMSKSNLNTMLDLFGNDIAEWVDKEIIVVASVFEGNDKVSSGYELKIQKA